MAVMSVARVFCVLLGAAWLGCSSPQPSGGSSTTDGGPATVNGQDERCLSEAYGDGDCDQCQNKNCCNERFACYDDKDCYWADWNLDECLDPGAYDAGTDSGGGWDSGGVWDSGGPTPPEECWKKFDENGGAAALTIDACIVKNCKAECGR